MDEELRLFRDLILAIWDNHRKPWFYPRGQARDIYLDIAAAFPSLSNRNALEVALPTEERVKAEFPSGSFIYLEPVNRGQVLLPVLSMKCDFGRSIPEVRLRLGLFLRHVRDIKAIGYRFEAPEGPGIHNYYHLQMIRGFRMGIYFPPNDCLEWFPDSAPAFPLDGNCPIKLVLGLLVSLYGIQHTANLLANANLGAQTSQYLRMMNCYMYPPVEWYWKVTTGSSKRNELYYSTEKDPETFKLHFRSRYVGCTFKGLTKGHYGALPSSKRRVHR
jgi:hypothetical protein